MRKVFRKLRHFFLRSFTKQKSAEEIEAQKQMDDYLFLTKRGVETELGFVKLTGNPIINKNSNSRIIIGKGVHLVSDSTWNVAGINHPVILATLAKDAVIEIGNGVGMSGTSVVAATSIKIGDKSMFGANSNLYDTDFHPIDPICRLHQKSILDAKCKKIDIGSNCWIGANSTILKGVTIGDNSVISAHSLVNKSVTMNSLYAGVPAKFIKNI